MVNYWWAFQNKNYKEAIAAGTLFTNEHPTSKATNDSRDLIKTLEPGDIVFHHYDSNLKAVSRVTSSYRDAERPDESPRSHPNETDLGWLVEVDPIRIGVDVHFSRVEELIGKGTDRPINSGGGPARGKFLIRLSEKEGLALLHECLGAPADPAEQGLYGRPDAWDGGDTDDLALGPVRREQAVLRRYLLDGRSTAPCAICGEELPARLLIAAHIKPRSECTEEERKDFKSVAMLACSLGCDALFEWGYIYVDSKGKVCRGIDPVTKGVEYAVDLVVHKICGVYNENTAPNFKAHEEMFLPS